MATTLIIGSGAATTGPASRVGGGQLAQLGVILQAFTVGDSKSYPEDTDAHPSAGPVLSTGYRRRGAARF
jgi:hypothetical protein